MGEGEEIEIKDVQIVDSLPLYANKRLEVIYMDVHQHILHQISTFYANPLSSILLFGPKRVGKSFLASLLPLSLPSTLIYYLDLNSFITKFLDFETLKIYLDMIFVSLEQTHHLIIIDHMDSKHQNKIF